MNPPSLTNGNSVAPTPDSTPRTSAAPDLNSAALAANNAAAAASQAAASASKAAAQASAAAAAAIAARGTAIPPATPAATAGGTALKTASKGPKVTTTLFRSAPPKSKNLVIINKGPGALTIPRQGTDWDVMEIFFMAADIAKIKADPTVSNAEHVVFETDRKMRKFAIIKAIFEKNLFWKKYDTVMMLDDDVVPVGCTVSDIFALFAKTGCRVGQPALTHDSFYGHIVNLKNDFFSWRLTNCAELMCPIFTREALIDYLPFFNSTVSGFGIDDYWSFHEWLKGIGLANLDATPVRHTRPVGGGTAYQGLSPDDECRDFMHLYAIPRYPHSSFGGALANGNPASSLAPFVAGYHRKYTSDRRYLLYTADQVAIMANTAAMQCDSEDPKVLKAHLDVIINVAATSIHMLTRDFHHHQPTPPKPPEPPAAPPPPAQPKGFWGWVGSLFGGSPPAPAPEPVASVEETPVDAPLSSTVDGVSPAPILVGDPADKSGETTGDAVLSEEKPVVPSSAGSGPSAASSAERSEADIPARSQG